MPRRLIITESEKNYIKKLYNFNILSETKNQFLIKEDVSKIESYPKCVQNLEEDPSNDGEGNYAVPGGPLYTADYTGYWFYNNNKAKNPQGTIVDYYCNGGLIALGKAAEPSTGGKTTTPELGGKILKVGSTGNAVKQVQNRLLNSLGTFVDPAKVAGNAACKDDVNQCDGKFGPETRNAVIKYQQTAKIKDDGTVGDQTWQQLFTIKPPETVTINDRQTNINNTWCNVKNGIINNPASTSTHNMKWEEYVSLFSVTGAEHARAMQVCPKK